MTELFEPTSALDPRLARSATGELAELNAVGLLEAVDVHVAQRVAVLAEEPDAWAGVGLALAVRAVRVGSVCLDLDAASALVAGVAPGLRPPSGPDWTDLLAGSRLHAAGVVRLEGSLLYLDRYHGLESQVLHDLLGLIGGPAPDVEESALAGALQRVDDEHLSAEQRHAVERAVRQRLTVLTGGPGTGKTTTVARLLVAVADQFAARGRRASIALAAPTGKAATRLAEAVADELARLDPADRELVGRPASSTLHRLLGWRPDNQTRFRHHRGNRIPADLLVVDESSMVDLTMMARLLEAVRPDARLVLVGDPRQLTSVGAGAVLADLVAGFEAGFSGSAGSAATAGAAGSSPVAALSRNFRSTPDILALADALRGGEGGDVDVDQVLAVLRAESDEVTWVRTPDETDATDDGGAGEADTEPGATAAEVLRDDLLATALAVHRAAEAGDDVAALAALDEHRLLCAHREGPFGVQHWNRLVERWLAEALALPVLAAAGSDWYVGRPLLVTRNDYALGVYNGETGVTVRRDDGRLRAVVSGSEQARELAPGRLDAVETMHAMTIHKSQGSQARRVTVLLPDAGSRLLTRELFYTAVTRAQEHVRVVGSEAAVRAAVATPAQRASGLRGRLVAGLQGETRNAGDTPSG